MKKYVQCVDPLFLIFIIMLLRTVILFFVLSPPLYGVNLIHETLFVNISTDYYNTGTNCWIFPSSHLTETIKDG